MKYIFIFIGIVLVMAGTYFVVSKKAELPQTSTTPEESTIQSLTVKEIFSTTESLTCVREYSTPVPIVPGGGKNELKTKNILYKETARLRIDKETDDAADHLIIDGENGYSWIDLSNTPEKYPRKVKLSYAVFRDHLLAYFGETRFQCEGWREEGSVFVPPPNLIFIEFNRGVLDYYL